MHLPDRIDGPLTLLFGFPGGGFGRRYYDVQKMPGYSQAEHHTQQGFGFVACDHLGVGDSDQPDTFSLTYENLAQANHATSQAVVTGLREGSSPGRRRADRGAATSSAWVNPWAAAC